MPGLALMPDQLQRLCGVDSAACQSVLAALVESGFLFRRPDGSYRRQQDTDLSRARAAKAGLEPRGGIPAFRSRSRAS